MSTPTRGAARIKLAPTTPTSKAPVERVLGCFAMVLAPEVAREIPVPSGTWRSGKARQLGLALCARLLMGVFVIVGLAGSGAAQQPSLREKLEALRLEGVRLGATLAELDERITQRPGSVVRQMTSGVPMTTVSADDLQSKFLPGAEVSLSLHLLGSSSAQESVVIMTAHYWTLDLAQVESIKRYLLEALGKPTKHEEHTAGVPPRIVASAAIWELDPSDPAWDPQLPWLVQFSMRPRDDTHDGSGPSTAWVRIRHPDPWRRQR
jgi:hypothetical protein